MSAGAAQHRGFAHERQNTNEPIPVDAIDPAPLLANLTRCAMEVLAGARDIEQLARWVSEDAFRHLLKRSILADRARRVKGVAPTRPVLTIGRVISDQPAPGVVEAVVMVHQRARSRAVAIRLEAFNGRWRAAAIHVL